MCGVGFAARLDGVANHEIICTALTAMDRMAHRGGHVGGKNSSDGAGLLTPLPREFFAKKWPALAARLGLWAVGQLFLPREARLRDECLRMVKNALASFGLSLADGRDVPVRAEILSADARDVMPRMEQILVLPNEELDPAALERRLYIARRRMEKTISASLARIGGNPRDFYVPSLSCRSIVYKGMIPGGRLAELYTDLAEESFAAPFAVFHERFSTNTLPSWALAQPFRLIAHNGEINTLRGNEARMNSRECMLSSSILGDELAEVLPVIEPSGSDSAKFDNVLELLTQSGRSLPHALMMMVPEPFGSTYVMGDNKRAFYEYHAALMEPWDGPTAMVFTDGYRRVGAALDRNGLRPCRYHVTADGLVVLASEAGVADDGDIVTRGQLRPRQMLMVDVERHHIAPDTELKGRVVRAEPYRRWLRQHCILLHDLHGADTADDWAVAEPELTQRLFGYEAKRLRKVLVPMAANAQEPVEAMGSDEPLAALDELPRSLFDYFRQNFAQVTNPPIDPLREELSMSLMGFTGRERNLLEPTPEHCAMLRLQHPFLTARDMRRLRASTNSDIKAHTIDATFPQNGDGAVLTAALHRLFSESEQALKDGATLLVLSDTRANGKKVPIPALLAVSALHHHLLRKGLRHTCGIIAETGEAFEVMHMAQLIGYGASAIHPHAALFAVEQLARNGKLGKTDVHDAQTDYINALKKGLLKAFARLGISTLRSFRGAQTFEAIGLSQEVVDACFTGTASRLGGLTIDGIAAEANACHAMNLAGQYEEDASPRLWTREAVDALHAASLGDADAYARFAAISDAQKAPITLRSLLDFVPKTPVPLEKVEPASAILRRFTGAAMSFGALSAKAHETIAVAMNSVGSAFNCGEGGEDPDRNILDPARFNGCDRHSKIRQLASGRFGVTAQYLVRSDEIQIKIAQGAKPGEGGHLPAGKVTADIARVRHTLKGISLVSPPPHHDIYSIEDLAQLIYDLRRLNPTARISVKLVSELGVGTVAVGVAKAGADTILISGHDGGTGASPHSAIQHVGMPWEYGLSEAHRALVESGLRDRVHLQTDGQLHTGRDIAIAALLGAEGFGFGTSLLVSMGCVMCRQCHKGRCAAGIATQDETLCHRFKGTPERIVAFLSFVAEDLRRLMARLGFSSVDEMVGRVETLCVKPSMLPKASTLDLARLLAPSAQGRSMPAKLSDNTASDLERQMEDAARPVLDGLASHAAFEGSVRNTDRAVGTRLAGEVVRHFGAKGLAAQSLSLTLRGSAGQSLGAFLAPGMSLTVIGEANDYVGKGLSGGVISLKPSIDDVLPNQAIAGNVALYGATSGELYCGGMAGERFAVRNSGAVAVVEGVGDHGCEYMTGGVVVVLGPCGYNFAAGMSGGVAYVYDDTERFQNRCNLDSVNLESVWTDDDKRLLRRLLETHVRRTGSPRAEGLLRQWDAALPLFVKVMPLDYKDALRRQRDETRHDPDTMSATEEVFNAEEHTL